MTHQSFLVTCATLGRIGYLPASGTIASLCALPFAFFLSCITFNFLAYAGILIILFLFATLAAHKALAFFSMPDPGQIVIDEVIGCLIAFFAIPFSFKAMIVGMVLFRLFDITKICGIDRVEKIDGAWGVMLDDVVAGIYTNLILHGLILLHII